MHRDSNSKKNFFLDLLESIRKENFILQQKNEELTLALNVCIKFCLNQCFFED